MLRVAVALTLGALVVGCSRGAVEETTLPLSTTAATSTTTTVVPAPGRIVGTLRDGGNGLPIGAMFEQGVGLIGVAVVTPDGTVVAWADNRCDGSFAAEVPAGRYALLAGVGVFGPSYWTAVWAPAGSPSVISGERLHRAFAGQEAVVPLTAEETAGAEWFDLPSGGEATVDAALPPGAAAPPAGVWFEGLPQLPQLAADDPRRDPAFWVGRTMTFAPTPLETRPTEQLLLDGGAIELWAVVQSRAPQDADLPRVALAHPVEGHDICWDPGSGYGFLFVVGADSRVIDAVVLDLGEAGFACWHHGEPQPLPDPRPTVVLGHREQACGPPLGAVDEAWVLEPAGLVEIDPAGADYLYPYD